MLHDTLDIKKLPTLLAFLLTSVAATAQENLFSVRFEHQLELDDHMSYTLYKSVEGKSITQHIIPYILNGDIQAFTPRGILLTQM
ncbi:MAG: hypothetical protein IH946_09830, partial [Bacteroidetes bacterium]|nr:hypothetical protein [Bacteroidota bacterium]